MTRLSEQEFESIVNDSVLSVGGGATVSVAGLSVDVNFPSNSGKTHFDARLDFDETGSYTVTAFYMGTNPSFPRVLGGHISERIQARLRD